MIMPAFLALFPIILILPRSNVLHALKERSMIYNWENVLVVLRRILFLMDRNVLAVEKMSIIIQHHKDALNVIAIRVMIKNKKNALVDHWIHFGMERLALLATFLSTLTLIHFNAKIVPKGSSLTLSLGFANLTDLAYSWLLIYIQGSIKFTSRSILLIKYKYYRL